MIDLNASMAAFVMPLTSLNSVMFWSPSFSFQPEIKGKRISLLHASILNVCPALCFLIGSDQEGVAVTYLKSGVRGKLCD